MGRLNQGMQNTTTCVIYAHLLGAKNTSLQYRAEYLGCRSELYALGGIVPVHFYASPDPAPQNASLLMLLCF